MGATNTLLFAPKSGAELRTDLQATVEKDLLKLQADSQAATARTNKQLDQMQADLKQGLEQGKGKEGEGEGG